MSGSTFVEALVRARLVVLLAILESRMARFGDRLKEFKREAARAEWAAWAERQARGLETQRLAIAALGRDLARRYNPNWPSQPRVPRGNPDGGQWTDGGGGVGEPTGSLADRGRPESADDVPGVPVSDDVDPSLGEPPEIPVRRPPKSEERNAIIRNLAKWLKAVRKAGGPIIGVITYIEATWLENDLNEIETYLDEPRTFEELQRDVAFPRKGTHVHHIVEQTPARKEKFPDELIDAPENKVRIPTLLHREITGWYNRPNKDYGGRTPREYLRGKSWQERYDLGLQTLREFGALKP